MCFLGLRPSLWSSSPVWPAASSRSGAEPPALASLSGRASPQSVTVPLRGYHKEDSSWEAGEPQTSGKKPQAEIVGERQGEHGRKVLAEKEWALFPRPCPSPSLTLPTHPVETKPHCQRRYRDLNRSLRVTTLLCCWSWGNADPWGEFCGLLLSPSQPVATGWGGEEPRWQVPLLILRDRVYDRLEGEQAGCGRRGQMSLAWRNI